MGIPVISDILKVIKGPLEEIITDKDQRNELSSKLAHAFVGLLQGQQAANIESAKHDSVFVAGARPAIMWVLAVSLGFYFIPQYAMGAYVWTMACLDAMEAGQALPEYPVKPDAMMELVTGMLGMATLRTYEKIKGVARDTFRKPKK